MQQGLTLIELLLTIAIVAVIASTSTPLLSRLVLHTQFDSTGEKLIGSIRKAQAYSMDGKDDQVWGVCKSENSVLLYSGSCLSPNSTEEIDVADSITISDFSDISFNTRGEPSQAITISVSSDIDALSVVINEAGGIDVN